MGRESQSRTDSGLSSMRMTSHKQLTPAVTSRSQMTTAARSASNRTPTSSRGATAVTSTPFSEPPRRARASHHGDGASAAPASEGPRARSLQREAARLRRHLAAELLRDADECENDRRTTINFTNPDITNVSMVTAVGSPAKPLNPPTHAPAPAGGLAPGMSSSTSERMQSCTEDSETGEGDGVDSQDGGGSDLGGGGDTARRRRSPSPDGISGVSTISSRSMPQLPPSPARGVRGRPKPEIPAGDLEGSGDGVGRRRSVGKSLENDEDVIGSGIRRRRSRKSGSEGADSELRKGREKRGKENQVHGRSGEFVPDFSSALHRRTPARLNTWQYTSVDPPVGGSRNYKFQSATPGTLETHGNSTGGHRRQLLEAVSSVLSSQLEDEAGQLRADYQLQLQQLQQLLAETEGRQETELVEMRRQVAVAEATLRQTSRELSRQLTLKDAQLEELREELRHTRRQHSADREKMTSELHRRLEQERTALGQQHCQRLQAVSQAATARLKVLGQQHETAREQSLLQIKTDELEVSRLTEELEVERHEKTRLQRELEKCRLDRRRLKSLKSENEQLRKKLDSVTSELTSLKNTKPPTSTPPAPSTPPAVSTQLTTDDVTSPADQLTSQLTAARQLAAQLRQELQAHGALETLSADVAGAAPSQGRTQGAQEGDTDPLVLRAALLQQELQRLQMLQLQLHSADALQLETSGTTSSVQEAANGKERARAEADSRSDQR